MSVTLRGVEDVNRLLTQIAPREGINLIRATVQDIAVQLAKSAKENSPTDGAPLTLRPAIKAKRRRGTRNRVQSDVTVDRSAYFWRFLEYGDGPDNIEWAMFLKALQEMRPNMERVYLEAFAKKLVARLARMKKG